ncbi:MAG: hypothetical protein R3B99_21120, partial [Polyangiales bacterium]
MKPTLPLLALSTLLAACGAASAPSTEHARSEHTSTSEPPHDLRLGIGADASIGEGSEQSTVFVRWRDEDGEHSQHLLTVDAGSGEGAGDFARLDELEWPEGKAVLEANRP